MAISTTSLLSDVVFGLDLLAMIGTNVDIVGIFSDTSQVYVHARPMKASVPRNLKVMDHPVETGVVLSDHHIINPVDEIPMVVPAVYYAAVYQQIKADFLAATMLTVKTPVNVYGSMIIADMPHEESPEHFNAIIIGLHLKTTFSSRSPAPPNRYPRTTALRSPRIRTPCKAACNPPLRWENRRLPGRRPSPAMPAWREGSEMLQLPIQAVPNQEFQAVLDGNTWSFTIRSTNDVMSMTLVLNGTTLIQNLRCVAGAFVIPSQYEESGNFLFLTTNNDLPDYAQD